jgi:hypothetical protein
VRRLCAERFDGAAPDPIEGLASRQLMPEDRTPGEVAFTVRDLDAVSEPRLAKNLKVTTVLS